MKVEKIIKDAVTVIGKEGSTANGKDFIEKLWADANAHFHEVQYLAKKDADGTLVGIWGAMSDFSRSFQPWENNFSQGLYLAGVECIEQAEAPAGWTKWTIPAYEYIYVEQEDSNTFPNTIRHIKENRLPLVGATHEFTCPKTGKSYLFFPIKKI